MRASVVSGALGLVARRRHGTPDVACAADPVYASVMLARRPEVLQAVLREALPGCATMSAPQVVQTNYKPRVRARLMVRAGGENRSPQWLYLELHPTLEHARRACKPSLDDPPAGGELPVLLPSLHAACWQVPHAPRLEAAAFAFDGASFAGFMRRNGLAADAGSLPRLVRYVPRRRALFHCGAPQPLYIKCYKTGQDSTAAENLRCLEAAHEPGFDAPRLLAHDAPARAVVASEIPGALFSHCTTDLTACRRVGSAVASLHDSGIVPTHEWTAQRETGALRDAMEDVSCALPSLAPALDRLIDGLAASCERLDFPTDAPIHANLFGDQILVSTSRVGIVDWDDLARGDPLYDIGRLIAHIMYLGLIGATPGPVAVAVRALLDGYAGGDPLDEPRLRWHVAMALLMRAKISALRPLPDGWPAHVAAAIRCAETVLWGREWP